MKKKVALMLIATMTVFMTSCGSNNDNIGAQQEQTISENDTSELKTDPQEKSKFEDISDTEAETGGSNILVAYFSRVGNTEWEDGVDVTTSASLNVEDGEYVGNAELLARMAQQVTGGDLFLIETEEAYPSDYRETTDVATEEQDNDARPALASHVENMDSYDTIVLIYPNWWGTLPQPLFTFLEEYDFSGKAILPLCTHEGSGMGSSERELAELCPGATLLDGLAVRGSAAASSENEVRAWIENSGILE